MFNWLFNQFRNIDLILNGHIWEAFQNFKHILNTCHQKSCLGCSGVEEIRVMVGVGGISDLPFLLCHLPLLL